MDLGVSKSPEPTTYTKEELDKYFGVGMPCVDALSLSIDNLTIRAGL